MRTRPRSHSEPAMARRPAEIAGARGSGERGLPPENEHAEGKERGESADDDPTQAIEAVRQGLYGSSGAAIHRRVIASLLVILRGLRRRGRAGNRDVKGQPGGNAVARVKTET